MSSSSTPFDPVVSKGSLGPLGKSIGENNGESEGVYPLTAHTGWLLKVFKSNLITGADITRIDSLITLAMNASEQDRALLSTHASWPAARVTDGSCKTYGVLIPLAPSEYWVNLQLSPNHTKHKPLEIDWLAKSPEICQRRGVPVPSFVERLQICENLVAVGEFLERHQLVYGDWSYANAFWSAEKNSGYVIDLDGCGFRTRNPRVTQNWEDPLPTGGPTDALSDRWGVSLLLARCLTGEREATRALNALRKITSQYGVRPLYDQVRTALEATDRSDRPTTAALLAAVRAAETSTPSTTESSNRPADGVVGWRDIRGTRSGTTRRTPARQPRPTSPPAAAVPNARGPSGAPPKTPQPTPTRPTPRQRPQQSTSPTTPSPPFRPGNQRWITPPPARPPAPNSLNTFAKRILTLIGTLIALVMAAIVGIGFLLIILNILTSIFS